MFVRAHLSKSLLLFVLVSLNLLVVSCDDSNTSSETAIVSVTEDVSESATEISTDDELSTIIKSAGIQPDTSASPDAFMLSWTNGSYWISPEVTDNHEYVNNGIKILEFMGGDRHEGGYNFQAALLNDTTVIILNSSVIECTEGDLLLLKNQAEIAYIKILGDERETKGVFVLSDLTLGNDIDIKVQENLAGTFFEKATGDTIQFIDSTKTIMWNSEEFKFKFESDEYDALVDVISFQGQSFFFEREGDQLKLTQAQLNEEESFIEWLPIGNPRYFQLISKSDEPTFKDFLNKVK